MDQGFHFSMQLAELIVSFEAPHRLLAIEIGTNEILGFSEQLLLGRTLQVFYGPTTDSARITSAIKASAFCTCSILQVDFYKHSGACQTVSASFKPFYDTTGALVGCSVLFETYQAITMEEALQGRGSPQVLVAADDSHYIQLACRLSIGLLENRSANLLRQPFASFASNPAHLSALLHSSAAGRIERGIVRMRTASLSDIACGITCIPVVPRHGAQISHVLILLFPATIHGVALTATAIDTAFPATPEASDASRSTVAAASAAGHASPSSAAGNVLRHPPRSAFSMPVTLELLRSLGDVPLYRAAERLGMSPSTLKTTCRRLGLARWPRGGLAAAAADGLRAANAQGAEVDVAYARRLYRKYAAPAAHSPASPATPAGESVTEPAAVDSERPFDWDWECPAEGLNLSESCLSESSWECLSESMGMSGSPGLADSDTGGPFLRDAERTAAAPAVQAVVLTDDGWGSTRMKLE
jgi:hypothetical protein